MNWIAENAEWLFSGIAVAIPIAIIGWFFFTSHGSKQVQKSGKNSTNFQIGGDLKVDGDLKVGRGEDDK